MDFLALAFRHAIPQERKYLPYSFDGEWSESEKAAIEAAIDPHVPERVTPTFNNWAFSRYEWGFSARRATWDMGSLHADSAQELAGKIAGYYSPTERARDAQEGA